MKKHILCVAFLLLSGVAEGALPRSAKRGVGFNEFPAKAFPVLSKGVSWVYNWGVHPPEGLLKPGVNLDYYPMFWNAHPDFVTRLDTLLAKGFKPKAVLVMNEPNLRGQAFVTPEQCAAQLSAMQKTLTQRGLRMVGPHYAMGSAEWESIKAYDPIEKKDVTYQFFIPYMRAFHHYLGPQKDPFEMGLHLYGNIYEVRWILPELEKQFPQAKFWITEFNNGSYPSDEAALDYLIECVDFLERQKNVVRYAWFKADMENNRNELVRRTGELTAMGKAYLQMPAIDPERWDATNQTIPACAAAVLSETARVRRCKDGTQPADVVAEGEGAKMEFHLQGVATVPRLRLTVKNAAHVIYRAGKQPERKATVRNEEALLSVPTSGKFVLQISADTPGSVFHELRPAL